MFVKTSLDQLIFGKTSLDKMIFGETSLDELVLSKTTLCPIELSIKQVDHTLVTFGQSHPDMATVLK